MISLATFSLLAEENETLNLLSFDRVEEVQAPPAASSEELAQKEIELFFEDEAMPPPSEEASLEEIAVPGAIEPKGVMPEQALSVEKKEIKLDDQAPTVFEKKAIGAPSAVKEEMMVADSELANLEAEVDNLKGSAVMIDFNQVFSGSPIIYTLLLLLSVGVFSLWLYSMLSLRTSQVLPGSAVGDLRTKLQNREYDEALNFCKGQDGVLFRMLTAGLSNRHQGHEMMLGAMKTEGKRATTSLWQKIHLLNDVAILAPMLGLLGTVLGMFYAFYDLNRSMESISALFDGLGISVGTTVGGLVVAILAMMFYSMTKYRLVRQLTLVENEAESLASMIDTKGTP